MKVYILAAIMAISPTLSNAETLPTSTETTSYVHQILNSYYHHIKMTPRTPLLFACKADHTNCKQDSDCCNTLCIGNKCE
jgi:hypothetical protein